MEYIYSSISWYEDSENPQYRFRPQGPCTIYKDGEIKFSQIDSRWFNRKKGPCSIMPSGRIRYCTSDGSVHRTDGPAVIHADGSKEYYVDNQQLTVEEFFSMYGVL